MILKEKIVTIKNIKKAVWVLALSYSCGVFAANEITNIRLEKESPYKDVLIIDFTEPLQKIPVHFSISNPQRIVFDASDTKVAVHLGSRLEFKDSLIPSVQLAESTGRSRVVLNVAQSSGYTPRIQGRSLIVELSSRNDIADDASSPSVAKDASSFPEVVSDRSDSSQLGRIDFRRLVDAGRITIDLQKVSIPYEIRKQGKNLLIDFPSNIFASGYDRRYDVTDFGTLVRQIEARNNGRGSQVAVFSESNEWEYSSYQTGQVLSIDMRKKNSLVPLNPTHQTIPGSSSIGQKNPDYKGQRLSLNFQNVDVRTILQVIADFTGLNIIASDEVSGQITLRLKDVPWDQALDIIMQSKGLDQRRVGNVIHIAPRDRLLERDKAKLEASRQLESLEELRSETFKLRYKKVDEFKSILDSASGDGKKLGLLSERGSALIDPKTNILIINDVRSNIEKVRTLLKDLDLPARQVMIEARIVEATDTFQRDLGVKLGFAQVNGNLSIGSNMVNAAGNIGVVPVKPDGSPVNSNLGDSFVLGENTGNVTSGANSIGNGANTIGLVFKRGLASLIGLEILAGQNEGKTKVLSNPKVMTTDRVNAVIKSGTQIPYETYSNSGTKIEFKDAVLSLNVTPQITNNDEIIMDLAVNNDEPGASRTISTKALTTQVRVENGGTLVIGGVFKKNQTNSVNKVPLLGDIPLLGRLFRADTNRENNTELLIFITPTIIEGTEL
jgi:type IV pilus assembly protein PilQ